jgi:hypothetical protein
MYLARDLAAFFDRCRPINANTYAPFPLLHSPTPMQPYMVIDSLFSNFLVITGFLE